MPFLMKPRTCSFCCLLCLLLAFPVPKFLGIRLRGVVMCQANILTGIQNGGLLLAVHQLVSNQTAGLHTQIRNVQHLVHTVQFVFHLLNALQQFRFFCWRRLTIIDRHKAQQFVH